MVRNERHNRFSAGRQGDGYQLPVLQPHGELGDGTEERAKGEEVPVHHIAVRENMCTVECFKGQMLLEG
jgi:hypothetical protein